MVFDKRNKVKIVVVLLALTLSFSLSYNLLSTETVRAIDTPGHANANYTIGFQPRGFCSNDDYIFVLGLSTWRVVYRSNLTLKASVSTPANLSNFINDAKCDENYLYVGGKAQNFGSGAGSICGWRICKYTIPDLTYVGQYLNTSWNFPEFFSINDTYMFATGSKSSSTAGLIKLYLSNMTESCPTTVHDYGALNYVYRVELSPDQQWLYASIGVKTAPGYIGKYYASNITYHSSYQVAPSGYYNMQHIIAPTNDLTISSIAPADASVLIACVDSSLVSQWDVTWSGASTAPTQLCSYNDSHFFAALYTGIVNCRKTSDGSVSWNYNGFDNGYYIYMTTNGRFMYLGGYDGAWILRNVTISSTSSFSPSSTPQFIYIEDGTNSTFIYTQTPTTNWTILTNTSEYWLQIDNDADFSSPEVNLTNITECNYPTEYDQNSTRVSFTLPVANKVDTYGWYYIRVYGYVKQ